jgi:hypothetical protein
MFPDVGTAISTLAVAYLMGGSRTTTTPKKLDEVICLNVNELIFGQES